MTFKDVRAASYPKMHYAGPGVTGKPTQLTIVDAPRPPKVPTRPLFGMDRAALTALVGELGEPVWRGRQLAQAIYSQRVTALEEITPLPLTLRRRMAENGWEVGRPAIVQVFQSVDGTERYLVQGHTPGASGFPDTVETVWMPEGDEGETGDGTDAGQPSNLGAPPSPTILSAKLGAKLANHKPWDRATICVSSQVGCAVNCQFCLTAKLGLQRNLSAGKIAGQVFAVLDRHAVEIGKDRVNLVFMGMGEPLLNYDNFMGAVRLLVEESGLSPLRMTVSTSGIVPGIERFAAEPPEIRPKLAISLNAPNDAVRSEVMPVNRKWPIETVIDAVKKVPLRPRERVTFEYVLLGGVTDRPEHAREVARLVRRAGLPTKVNLIAWNPGPGVPYEMPQTEAVDIFRAALAA